MTVTAASGPPWQLGSPLKNPRFAAPQAKSAHVKRDSPAAAWGYWATTGWVIVAYLASIVAVLGWVRLEVLTNTTAPLKVPELWLTLLIAARGARAPHLLAPSQAQCLAPGSPMTANHLR